MYFRQVDFGLITNFPMPPLPPIQPVYSEIQPSSHIGSKLRRGDAHALILGESPKISKHASSLVSERTMPTDSTTDLYSARRSPALVLSGNQPTSINAQAKAVIDNGSISVSSSENEDATVDITTQPLPARYFIENDQTITTMTRLQQSVLRYQKRMASMSDASLAMHLYRSYQLVIACQEAMWEELKDRLRNRREELVAFGWDEDEELEDLNSRQKFEKLIERYEMYDTFLFLVNVNMHLSRLIRDMKARLSLWRSSENLGFKVPRKDSMTKAELLEEQRLRESMIEARKQATKQEMLMSCRALRVMVGHKPT